MTPHLLPLPMMATPSSRSGASASPIRMWACVSGQRGGKGTVQRSDHTMQQQPATSKQAGWTYPRHHTQHAAALDAKLAFGSSEESRLRVTTGISASGNMSISGTKVPAWGGADAVEAMCHEGSSQQARAFLPTCCPPSRPTVVEPSLAVLAALEARGLQRRRHAVRQLGAARGGVLELVCLGREATVVIQKSGPSGAGHRRDRLLPVRRHDEQRLWRRRQRLGPGLQEGGQRRVAGAADDRERAACEEVREGRRMSSGEGRRMSSAVGNRRRRVAGGGRAAVGGQQHAAGLQRFPATAAHLRA